MLLLLSVCLKIGDVLWNPANCLLQGCCLFLTKIFLFCIINISSTCYTFFNLSLPPLLLFLLFFLFFLVSSFFLFLFSFSPSFSYFFSLLSLFLFLFSLGICQILSCYSVSIPEWLWLPAVQQTLEMSFVLELIFLVPSWQTLRFSLCPSRRFGER